MSNKMLGRIIGDTFIILLLAGVLALTRVGFITHYSTDGEQNGGNYTIAAFVLWLLTWIFIGIYENQPEKKPPAQEEDWPDE